MTDETSEAPPTRRIDPGLTQRLSLGMGTLTLAGAAFFGVVQADVRAADDDSASVVASANALGSARPDDAEEPARPR